MTEQPDPVSPPILVTKLYVPSPRPAASIVPRSRLIERLNEGLERAPGLTLISAPAGFGKTTLVSDWLCQKDEGEGMKDEKSEIHPSAFSLHPSRVAWLSLDDSDNDFTRFLTYFIAALQQLDPKIGQTAQGLLQSPQPPRVETLMTTLVNDISSSFANARCVFVLDDYHFIEAKVIDEALTFLLDHLPPPPGGLQLIIATRDDPHLPLARLRVQGRLTELRAADLRFTTAEAAQFLNRVMGLHLSADDIAALEQRTEGWIAGLQLAAISMQKHEDTRGFIRSFTGSHRFILDYLTEEILEQQPANIQQFLLHTSVLNRLTGSLCDAVLGKDEGGGLKDEENRSSVILEYLEHANLFIVPLDEKRQWYRYHHLFADLLRQRLHQNQPEQAPILHRRASDWYHQNGFVDEAIEYALHAEHFDRATQLIEGAAEVVWMRGEHTKLRRWLDRLPVEWVYAKPQLCIFYAWSLFVTGRPDVAEQTLQAAEKAIDPNSGAGESSPRQARGQPSGLDRIKLQGRIAATRAFMAFFRGDVSGIVQHARQALEYLPEQDLIWCGTATVTLGDAHIIKGEMAAAHQAQLEALKASRAVGNIYMILTTSLKLALTLRQQGQLQQSIQICRQQMQFANENGLSQTGVVGWLLAIWGEVLAELNDLDEAIQKASEGIELVKRGGDVAMVGWSYLCLTRVLFSREDMAGAEETIREMGHIARETDVPPWVMHLLATWQARIWLAQGKLNVASQWAQEHGLYADRGPALLHEIEINIMLARVLMAQGRLDETIRLLQRSLNAAKAMGRTSRAIECLILQALAFQAGGDADQAITALEKALILAEPGGYVRILVDEGQPLTPLLREAITRDVVPSYAGKILAAFPSADALSPAQSTTTGHVPAGSVPTLQSDLVEPLSERELEVLQLIAAGLTNREIAAKLFLTVNTVKVHAHNIYGKLDAHSRTQAVATAKDLGILPDN
ncbi:MAG: Serine/threonine-protein kinase PknK [Anaerolineae bacterium]|nr:Serine/threonine-protein kinase PknK [Anaerolineae bacterium]